MKIFNRVFENKSFIRKGPKGVDDRFGCYFITGRLDRVLLRLIIV